MMDDFRDALQQYIGKPVVETVCEKEEEDEDEDEYGFGMGYARRNAPICTQKKDRGLLVKADLNFRDRLDLVFSNSDKGEIRYKSYYVKDTAKLCALKIAGLSVGEIYHTHLENKAAAKGEKEECKKRLMDLLDKSLEKDGIIRLRDGDMTVSKKLLCNISPIFKEKFGEGSVISIPDPDPAGVRLFIEILTGKVLRNENFVPRSGVPTAIKLLHQFQCGTITNFVPRIETLLCEDAALEILGQEGTLAFGDEALRKVCWEVIGKRKAAEEGGVRKRYKPSQFPITIKNAEEYSALMSDG